VGNQELLGSILDKNVKRANSFNTICHYALTAVNPEQICTWWSDSLPPSHFRLRLPQRLGESKLSTTINTAALKVFGRSWTLLDTLEGPVDTVNTLQGRTAGRAWGMVREDSGTKVRFSRAPRDYNRTGLTIVCSARRMVCPRGRSRFRS